MLALAGVLGPQRVVLVLAAGRGCPARPPPPARASTRPGRRGAGRRAGAGRRSTPGRAGRTRAPSGTAGPRRSPGPRRAASPPRPRHAGGSAAGARFNSRTTAAGSQCPPRTASVSSRRTASASVESGHRVGQGARRPGRPARPSTSSGVGSAAVRTMRTQPVERSRRSRGTRTSMRVEGEQRRRGGEAVQGERGQAGDHRLRVDRAARAPVGRRRAAAGTPGAAPGRVQQRRVQPLLAGGRARVQQEHARAGSAARVRRAGTARWPRRPGRRAPAAARRSVPGAAVRRGGGGGGRRGERGVVVHDSGVPASDPSANRCYTPVDKSGQARPKVRVFECRKALVHPGVTASGPGFGNGGVPWSAASG